MCLYIKGDCESPNIASEDIIVYKVGYTRMKYRFFNLIKIPIFSPCYYHNFAYRKNKITSKVTLKIDGRNSINKGYHAWVNLHNAEHERAVYYPACSIGKFKIPKGSKYYLGDNNDIVSNQIIYLGIYEL